MTEVERFFRQIVRNLSTTDPARLRRPLPLSDIRDRIVPYRTNRRPLDLETSEDYELVLMRLCAGEGGLARVEPAEVLAEFQAEVGSSNPDLDILDRHKNAVLSLEHSQLDRAFNPEPQSPFAPPGQEAPWPEPAAPSMLPELEPADPLPPRCNHCKGALPAGRTVNFCPHCGQSQALTRCPVCRTEAEAGWRHCVSCGYVINAGPE